MRKIAHESFAGMLYMRRRELGMSQSELAAAAGVSRNYIASIENGLDCNVSWKVLTKVCKALHMEFSMSAKPYESFQDSEIDAGGLTTRAPDAGERAGSVSRWAACEILWGSACGDQQAFKSDRFRLCPQSVSPAISPHRPLP